ncbi:MAG: DUF1801 domain-containing protein [Caldilineaceae bacterium]
MPTNNQEVTAMIEGLNSPQKEICAQLRRLIDREFPALEEKWRWSRPVYATADGNICYMVANKNDVNFGFDHGAKLDDPKGLLKGTGANMRHTKIRKLEELDLDYCQVLLAQAIEIAHTVGEA